MISDSRRSAKFLRTFTFNIFHVLNSEKIVLESLEADTCSLFNTAFSEMREETNYKHHLKMLNGWLYGETLLGK